MDKHSILTLYVHPCVCQKPLHHIQQLLILGEEYPIEIDKKIYRSAIGIGVIQIHTHTCKCIYTYSFSTLRLRDK